ncbi:MAG: hypothetical protein ACO34C_07270, partial [Candidatus Kapaibacteriota bacterium]
MLYVLLALSLHVIAVSNTLHVGVGKQYVNPRLACMAAKPGDTVLIHNGQYQGAFFIENIQGISQAPI